jgi:hypothetical protein
MSPKTDRKSKPASLITFRRNARNISAGVPFLKNGIPTVTSSMKTVLGLGALGAMRCVLLYEVERLKGKAKVSPSYRESWDCPRRGLRKYIRKSAETVPVQDSA